MKNKMKKIILMMSFCLLALVSCTSEDSTGNSDNNGVILLKRLERSNNPDIDYYKYKGSKLNYISIGDETGQTWRLQFTYSGDLITKTEWFENNQPTGEKHTYAYSNNKLTEVRSYSPGANLESIDYYSYNSDGSVDVGYEKIFFDSNNNIIKIETYAGNVELFEYDNKNNPYKNITGFEKLYLLFDIVISGKNNLTRENRPYGKTYNYTYNSQNYPVSCEILRQGQPSIINNYYYE